MNFFNNLRVGSKILLGFFIILVLMAVTGGIALFQITRINASVTELADHLAKDQDLSDQIVARILLARFYANKYIRRQHSDDLKRFNEEFAHFEALLAEADREILKDERVKMLASIKTGLQDYGKSFAEVTRLMAKRRKILLEVLDIQGPLAEKKLAQLRESAFQAKDTIASFYAADAQRALLLMRLDAFKYLQQGNTKWVKKFEERYQETQVAFKKLDEEPQEATRHQLAQEAQAAINLYYQGFSGLQTDYAQQNQIIETQLNIIGPQIRKTASNMSDSVTADFDETNQAIHALVSYTWIELLIMMGLAILVGLSLAFAISRSITLPLTRLT
ncbi:MAG: MCP four helix bundle domain-containing protein [Candidatus Parabeggiatoa sp.]|nr:MCP four helix bundle domain-containing protein [Candidatus Parabeggiatoa sp.]